MISTTGIGSYTLSGAYGAIDQESFVRVIHRALNLGVIFFDTAEAYGEAERLLGASLGSRRHSVVIATKVGVKEGLKATLSRQYVLNACESSLTVLGTDYIDLYQIHFDDPDTPVTETVAALEELRTAGKIRHYGLGHFGPERMMQYCDAGDVFSMLAELSAAEAAARDRLIPMCVELGVGVNAFSVTGRGILTKRFGSETVFPSNDIRSIDPLFQSERLRSALRVTEWISTMARAIGSTPAQVAIAWVLDQPGVICALTGPSSIRHLKENLAAAADGAEGNGGSYPCASVAG